MPTLKTLSALETVLQLSIKGSEAPRLKLTSQLQASREKTRISLASLFCTFGLYFPDLAVQNCCTSVINKASKSLHSDNYVFLSKSLHYKND